MSISRHLALARWRRRAAVALIAAAVVATAVPALAAWSLTGTGGTTAAATTMPVGNSPAVAVTGTDVSVRWPASKLPSGAAVEGYIVRRFDALTGLEATVGAACAGTVVSTTCTESSVPTGNWVYTITPIQGGWAGAQSSPSLPATVS